MSSGGSTESAALTARPLALLSAVGIEKRFGPTRAVAGVDFSVAAGEVRALIGENGAGKSTLVSVLSGVHEYDAGEISLDGEHYRPTTPRDARDRGVVMVHQELSLAPHLTVAENLFLGLEPIRGGVIDRSTMSAKTTRALAELEHDDVSPHARVSSLSVATRQIVEIARALILDVKVLILDEPTSSLSRRDVDILFGLIRRLKSKGIGVVYISHFLEEVWEIADSFTVLRDGRSVAQGRMEQTSVSEIVRAMVGRDITEVFPDRKRAPGDVVMKVDGLSGDPLPLEVSFELRRGEILGIAGLMGAGRTEMARSLFGLAPVKEGRIRIGSYEGAASPELRWRQGVGLLSEDRQGEGLAVTQSVAFNLCLTRLGFFFNPKRLEAIARDFVEQLGIACRGPRQRVSELSGGNQQKLALARMLHHELDVLLLDEPTRGVDVGSKVQLYDLVARLAESGKAVLLISSYLPELLGLSDRIAVMSRGRLLAARPVAELDEETIMRQAVS